MLPLRGLLASYDSLSLSERAGSLVLARVAGGFSARLVGSGSVRTSGVLVWQRLVIEEGLLRGIVGTDEALALMRRAVSDDATDPRLEAFLSAWVGGNGIDAVAPPDEGHPFRVIRGGRSSLQGGRTGKRARGTAPLRADDAARNGS